MILRRLALCLAAFVILEPLRAEAADFDVLISSFHSDQVLRYDPSGSGLTGVFIHDRWTSPSDMAFGPDGNIYVCGGLLAGVRRYDGTTGEVRGLFVDTSSLGLEAVNEIEFGSDGHLYAADWEGTRILRFDGQTGSFVDVFAGVAGQIGNLQDFKFGPDGRLYVCDSYPNNRILSFDGRSGEFLGVFAQGDLLPSGIDFGPDGNLYVATGSDALFGVARFNGQTGDYMDTFVDMWEQGWPNDLAFGPDGDLYVTFLLNGQGEVRRYDGSTGTLVATIASGHPLDGPAGLAFTPEPGSACLLVAGAVLLAWTRRSVP